jgi:hypothetical protein
MNQKRRNMFLGQVFGSVMMMMQEILTLSDEELSKSDAGAANDAPAVASDANAVVALEEENEYSQKYVYKFNDPYVLESGFVHVTNNRIIVRFPIKPDPNKRFEPMHNVQLYLNKQIIFSSTWLPILTIQDLFKFKTMFYQIWHEYTLMTDRFWIPSSFVPFVQSECMTTLNQPSCKLSCFENGYITTVELDTTTVNSMACSAPPHHSVPIHLQFYFGSHLLLCSEKDLQNLDVATLHFVLSFILQKLMN